MVYSIDELREKVTPIAEKYQLRAVCVFGSYARNEATDDSDVDILVDIVGSKVKGWIIGGLFNDLCSVFGEDNVDLITTDAIEPDEANNRTPWFTENVMRDRVLVYEQ